MEYIFRTLWLLKHFIQLFYIFNQARNGIKYTLSTSNNFIEYKNLLDKSDEII